MAMCRQPQRIGETVLPAINQMIKFINIYTLVILCTWPHGVSAQLATTPPVVTFVTANISDSAGVVKQRAFDVLLNREVNRMSCMKYIDTHLRDSVAAAHASAHQPFTFTEIKKETGAEYGAFFSIDRFGYLLRLATRIDGLKGEFLSRTDFSLLQAKDTVDGANPYEVSLRRMLRRVVRAFAHKLDSTCSAPPDSLLPVVMGSVVIHKLEKGFGLYLNENAIAISNIACARILDSLRRDRRFLMVDIYSRDQMYARLHEYDIENNVLPTPREVALMGTAGLPVYLSVEIDSADSFKKIHVHVYAFANLAKKFEPIAQEDKVIKSDLETMYATLDQLAYKVLNKLHPAKGRYAPFNDRDDE